MVKGVNKVILVGNCGQEPETKPLPSGRAVTNINIATSKTWKDKQTGQLQERTEWHRVVLFNRLAEIVGHEMQMLDSRESTKQPNQAQQQYQAQAAPNHRNDDTDDIPF